MENQNSCLLLKSIFDYLNWRLKAKIKRVDCLSFIQVVTRLMNHLNFDVNVETHVGGHTSIHNQSKRKCEDLLRQQQSIHASFEKQFNQDKYGYRIHLAASIDVCDEVRKFVLKNAPQNDQMTCPKIQKDIVIACKIETIKGIIKELNGDYFSLLVDESFDVSCKE
ncbi:hypothetical protein H5410_028405 [Solanum commersonii]|uniref:DUF4371 domain-containing protein n=1 Tax=Solanum commersonii TaxID=4109 RepID=A0A9J5Z200_SOLCO|nr:hypothetical protein H5410_028405 [Solanum commersonii]